MGEDDDLRDVGSIDEDDYWDLPRIVVTDDSIVIEENDWVGSDVKKKFEDRILDDRDIEKLLDEGVVFSPLSLRDGGERSLEESVGGSVEKEDDVDVYAPKKSPDFYGLEAYGDGGEEYDPFVGVSPRDDSGEPDGVDVVESEEDVRRGGRSMLEVAGFRDLDREKHREEKRRDNRG